MNHSLSTKRIRTKSVHPFYNEIVDLEKKGHTFKDIAEILQTKYVYTGSFSSTRTAVESIRKERKRSNQIEQMTRISRKQLNQWIWKIHEKLKPKEQQLLEKCMEKYPSIKELHTSIQLYRRATLDKVYDAFLGWLKQQLSNNEQPFYHYAFRLCSDLQAVKNAFMLPFTNALLEGQVNRLKMKKRLTYGRASIQVLEKRVLYRL